MSLSDIFSHRKSGFKNHHPLSHMGIPEICAVFQPTLQPPAPAFSLVPPAYSTTFSFQKSCPLTILVFNNLIWDQNHKESSFSAFLPATHLPNFYLISFAVVVICSESSMSDTFSWETLHTHLCGDVGFDQPAAPDPHWSHPTTAATAPPIPWMGSREDELESRLQQEKKESNLSVPPYVM